MIRELAAGLSLASFSELLKVVAASDVGYYPVMSCSILLLFHKNYASHALCVDVNEELRHFI